MFWWNFNINYLKKHSNNNDIGREKCKKKAILLVIDDEDNIIKNKNRNNNEKLVELDYMHAIQINLIYFEDYNEAELIGIVKKDTNQYGVYNLCQRIGLVGDTRSTTHTTRTPRQRCIKTRIWNSVNMFPINTNINKKWNKKISLEVENNKKKRINLCIWNSRVLLIRQLE